MPEKLPAALSLRWGAVLEANSTHNPAGKPRVQVQGDANSDVRAGRAATSLPLARELTRIVTAWHKLPSGVRAGIIAMVGVSTARTQF